MIPDRRHAHHYVVELPSLMISANAYARNRSHRPAVRPLGVSSR
jgi:hypothetical protein